MSAAIIICNESVCVPDTLGNVPMTVVPGGIEKADVHITLGTLCLVTQAPNDLSSFAREDCDGPGSDPDCSGNRRAKSAALRGFGHVRKMATDQGTHTHHQSLQRLAYQKYKRQTGVT